MKEIGRWMLVLIILITQTYFLTTLDTKIKQLEEVVQLIVEVSGAQTELLIGGKQNGN